MYVKKKGELDRRLSNSPFSTGNTKESISVSDSPESCSMIRA